MVLPRSGRLLGARGVRVSQQVLRARRSEREFAAAKRLVRLREDLMCARCGSVQGVDAHHRRNRGMGGASSDPSVHAFSRLVWLCRGCHDWVGRNPHEAGWEGFLVVHGQFPCSEVPVFYRGRWVLLGDDGSVDPIEAEV